MKMVAKPYLSWIAICASIALAWVSTTHADSKQAARATTTGQHNNPVDVDLAIAKAVGLVMGDLQSGDPSRIAAHMALIGQSEPRRGSLANSATEFFSHFRKPDDLPMAYIGDMVTRSSVNGYVVSCTMLWYLEDTTGELLAFKTQENFYIERGPSELRVTRAVTTPLVLKYLHDRPVLNRKLRDAGLQIQQP
jgi:hypothetical protein